MTPPAGWPRRFEVRVGRGAAAVTYRVVTWAGPTKAESLARDAYRRDHPVSGDQPAGEVGEVVEVVEVAPPARTTRGTVALDPHDVVDRLEF